MGENFVEAAKRVVAPGMNGPFCIEGCTMRMQNSHPLSSQQESLQEATSTWMAPRTTRYCSTRT